MKAITLLLGFFLFYHTQVQNDLTRQKLKGRVKSLTNCQCPAKADGKIATSGCTIYTFKYDINGNQVEDNDYIGGNLYTGFGTLNHKRIYKYDDEGRQVEVDEYNTNGSLTQKVIHK